MANASAKKTAAQNEQAIRILRLGFVVTFFVSILARLLLGRSLLHPSKSLALIFIVTASPSLLLWRYLETIGTVKRDSSGALISPGEDLNQPGVTDYCWDVIYITWACQIGSSLLGEWVWWLYLTIPIYAIWKLWNLLAPLLFGFGKNPLMPGQPEEDNTSTEGLSKRQQKLRKREERGDARVRRVQK